MEKRAKVVILFVLGLLFLLILIQQDSDYHIIDVKDGNTIVLECGTTVKLIGISSTEESLDFLRDHYLNEPINLKADHTSPFDPTSIRSGDVVYAYVLGGEDANIHINAQLLKEGKADILTGTFLADSLEAFRQYAKLGGRERDEELTPTLNEASEPAPNEPSSRVLPLNVVEDAILLISSLNASSSTEIGCLFCSVRVLPVVL